MTARWLVYLGLLKKTLARVRVSRGECEMAEDFARAEPELGREILRWAEACRQPVDPSTLDTSDWRIEPETLLGLSRLDNIQQCVMAAIEAGVPGDLIETGVWRGGATIWMRALLHAYGDTARSVWVADSFQGLPRPDPATFPRDEGDIHWRIDGLAVSLDVVRANFARYGLLDDRVRFLPGWFRDTLPAAPIERLAVLRLDGDMYESTIVALRALYPKVGPGGYVIVDDCPALASCAAAVRDYRVEHHIHDRMLRIPEMGIFWQVGGPRATVVAEDRTSAPAEDSAEDPAIESAVTAAAIAPPARGTILVVDDNADNRELLRRRLVREGHTVLMAESGRQALGMLRSYALDIVLLDIMMPEMDGIAVLRAIKNDPRLKHLPIVMITAVDEIDSIAACLELGADDYVVKPFNAVILRARLGALFERKRLADHEQRQREDLERALVEIGKERQRSEALIRNILPATVARELETSGRVKPMYFEDATIVLADVVGFTEATEQLPADELVTILHDYFVAFDQIVDGLGLEKLKSIGDAYMFVGGMPQRSPSHPVDCVLAALAFQHAMAEMGRRGPVDWRLRIGVHSGPVIAGVVGIRKFAFDIWGETVNFACRVEASCAPGTIALSAATFARVKDFFACEKRERTRLKDGREVDTYVVGGIGRGFAAAPNPLEAFEARYATYFRAPLKRLPEFLAPRQPA